MKRAENALLLMILIIVCAGWQIVAPKAHVVRFEAAPDPVDPVDGVVQVEWETEGAASVELVWHERDPYRERRTSLPADGSYETPVSDMSWAGDRVLLYLYLGDEAGELIVGEDGWIPFSQRLEVALETPIEIVNFSASPLPLEHGGEVMIEWDVRNAEAVIISGFDRSLLPIIPLYGEPGDIMPLQGRYTVQLPDHIPGRILPYQLAARDANGVIVHRTLDLNVRCAVPDPIAPECPSRSNNVTLSWQPFEGGMIVHTGDFPIFMLDNGRLGFTSVPLDVEATPEPGLTPPAGRVLPDALFLNIWLADEALRERLGWALDDLQTYRAQWDVMAESDYNVIHTPTFTFFRWVDGRVIKLDYTTGTWQFMP